MLAPPLGGSLKPHLWLAEYNLYSAMVYNFGGAFVPNTCVRRGDQALGLVYNRIGNTTNWGFVSSEPSELLSGKGFA